MNSRATFWILCLTAAMWTTGCGEGNDYQPASSDGSSSQGDKTVAADHKESLAAPASDAAAPNDAPMIELAASPAPAGPPVSGRAAGADSITVGNVTLPPSSSALGDDLSAAELKDNRGRFVDADSERRSHNTEAYDHFSENSYLAARQNPLSTFSIDVDTASYANARRFLNRQQLPPPGAVRIEELVNYFTYDYPQPEGEVPFSVNVEVAACPWHTKHRLVRIGLKGREIEIDQRPLTNLVFLLDVSGSMRDANKLPLVVSAMKLLVEQLGENDRVAIVVYAGASGVVLPPTSAARKDDIMSALSRLSAGGSTNGGEGIELAYSLAQESFIEGGVNRVILCTDGDFNIGSTNRSELVPLIEKKAKSGVFLSVLGFGMGNYKDAMLEQLADKGNGNYGYIDTVQEARKVLVEQLSGTLVTIAKDVKIQVDFNPALVAAYRLIGYENRMLKAEDFRDDTKDAGEIGAGHTVTALYEVIPAGQPIPGADVEPSKYTTPPATQKKDGTEPGRPAEDKEEEPEASNELLTVRLRYKQPDADTSQALRVPVVDAGTAFDRASDDFRFAAAVAQFGLLLRDSKYRGEANFDAVLEIAGSALGADDSGYRTEFLNLARTARQLKGGER